jgi:hypothetical protein
MTTQSNRPKSSQISVCVKDLYRPIQHQFQENSPKPFRFKILNFKAIAKSISKLSKSIEKYQSTQTDSRNISPIKTDSFSFNIHQPQGLIIKICKSPGKSEANTHIKTKFSDLHSMTPRVPQRPFSNNLFPSTLPSVENNFRNTNFGSLHTQKAKIFPFIFNKKATVKLKLHGKYDKKVVNVPEAEVISGWET